MNGVEIIGSMMWSEPSHKDPKNLWSDRVGGQTLVTLLRKGFLLLHFFLREY
jgi:hypothetical protein